MMALSNQPPRVSRDGSQQPAHDDGEGDGGEADLQREPRAVNHPGEQVPVVPVDAEEVLGPITGAAEQMDAGRRATLHVGEGLDGIVGGDGIGEDRREHHQAQQEEAHLGRPMADQTAQRLQCRRAPGQDQRGRTSS
jgi:hypothetical protein